MQLKLISQTPNSGPGLPFKHGKFGKINEFFKLITSIDVDDTFDILIDDKKIGEVFREDASFLNPETIQKNFLELVEKIKIKNLNRFVVGFDDYYLTVYSHELNIDIHQKDKYEYSINFYIKNDSCDEIFIFGIFNTKHLTYPQIWNHFNSFDIKFIKAV
jgi:hypothetical protein